MSKECDVFSDSYGCIITKSIGYQAPYPLVRLGNGCASPGGDGVAVQAACFTALPLGLNAARGRLLTLDCTARDPCVSFLQLMDASRRPLQLDARVEFIAKVDTTAAASAVVARSEGNSWSTSLYVGAGGGAHTGYRRVLFRGALSASLRDSALWLVETTRDGGDARQLYHHTVDSALAGAVPDALKMDHGVGQALDVVALTADTAMVLGTGGLAMADRRHAKAHVVAAAPVANGGVAGDEKAVVFGRDKVLRVFDLRSPATPLMESSVSSYLCVKSVVGCPAALLVADDVVGVLDVRTLSTTASLQHSGDTVLDATVLSHRQGGVRVCSSTESGMLYDWTVAM